MKKTILSLILTTLVISSFCQSLKKENSVSLLFIGDIMGHGPQIKGAYNSETKTYDYSSVFKPVTPIISSVDFAIANLEVTLAGKPFKGYPQFSSPDNLAVSCKNSGIDVLVTANNHSCDRGKKGIVRTLKILDEIGMKHTGTFRNKKERDTNNLIVLDKNNIKVGILNYTYGTNGIPFPKPTIVNLIDEKQMESDIKKAYKSNLDKLIVFIHWGKEYKSLPNEEQKNTSKFLFNNGVDIIIGSHPHAIQPMIYLPQTKNNKEQFIAYSLGNFVSNQRKTKTDGGVMVKLTLSKKGEKTQITGKEYILTWVNRISENKKYKYEIIPCLKNKLQDLSKSTVSKKEIFIKNSRELLAKENINVFEYSGESITEKKKKKTIITFSEFNDSYPLSLIMELDRLCPKKNRDKNFEQMESDFKKYLKENNFKFDEKTWGFSRYYFDKNGKLKTLIFSIYENQLSKNKEEKFNELFVKFHSNYDFVSSDKRNFSIYNGMFFE